LVALPKEVFEKIIFYRREVDRIWGEYVRPGRSPALAGVPAQVDIFESEQAINVEIELPGVRADDIEVSVSTGVIVIEGERKKPDTEEVPGARYYQAERAYGRFQRMIELPMPADTSRLQACLRHGILEISIPKVADRRAKWRRVPVSEAEEAGELET
jgi:HSP20 family protein